MLMSIEIITVATHKEGKFEELIHNIYNIPIKVLGFGQKWTGFNMKNKLIYDYIQHMPDNKIIIFLDGFDTEIKSHIKVAITRFKKNNYKLVFSKEVGSQIFYAEKMVFNKCRNNLIGNCGLYMGYVKYLKIFLYEALKNKCQDDQVVMNNLCKKFNFIDIDEKEEIFQNLKIVNNYKYNNKAIFIGFPGTISLKRGYRGVFEYGQFFIIPILIVYIIILYIVLQSKNINKDKKYISISIITLIIFFICSKMDYSCII
jgi:hypothetical protein